MKIEVGKFYKTRNGFTVGPMRQYLTTQEPYYNVADPVDGYLSAWNSDGTADFFGHRDSDESYDLVEEVG